MKPTHWSGSDRDTDVTFHYKFSDLRKFIEHGKKEGNNGMIIIKKKGNVITYRGFGTINTPVTRTLTFHRTYFTLWDGEWNPDKIVNPPHTNVTYGFTTLDFSNINPVTKEMEMTMISSEDQEETPIYGLSKETIHKYWIMIHEFMYPDEPIKQWCLDDEDYGSRVEKHYFERLDSICPVVKKLLDLMDLIREERFPELLRISKDKMISSIMTMDALEIYKSTVVALKVYNEFIKSRKSRKII